MKRPWHAHFTTCGLHRKGTSYPAVRWVAAPLHAAIFRGVEWSTERALEGTLHAANALNLQVVSVGDWADVDETSDLARLMERPADLSATRTRAWVREHSLRIR
jgi:hypothetical protein